MTALSPPAAARPPADTAAALVLAGAGILSFAVVLHHPTLQSAHDAQGAVRAIHALGNLDRAVHGSLMALIALQTAAYWRFTARLGADKPLALMGFVAYALATATMMIPATLDGFVTPDLSDACLPASSCGAGREAMFALVSACIQDFTKLALAATSFAILFWAIAGTRTRLGVPILLIGLACAVPPLAVLWLSGLRLQPHNLALFLLGQVVWGLVAAWRLWRNEMR